MSRPTCSSSIQECDEPLVLDISTGKSIESPSPAESQDTGSVSEAPTVSPMLFCDAIRNQLEVRQTKKSEQVSDISAKILHLLLNQIIPCNIAAPSHFKDLSFDFENEYRVIYRIPSSDEGEVSFNFTDEAGLVKNKVDITKEVYDSLRANLNNIRGMKCYFALVKNTNSNPNLPEEFKSLTIDITKEGLTEFTKEDFAETADDKPEKDIASLVVYHAKTIKAKVESVTQEYATALFNAVLLEQVPHAVWVKDEQLFKETEDKWYVAVKMSDDSKPEELRQFFVKVQNSDENLIANVDVTEEVHKRVFERVADVKGCSATKDTYELDGLKVPVLALVIDKHVE